MCPARCEKKYFVTTPRQEEEDDDYDDDQCFDGTDCNPWAVRQTDSANVLEVNITIVEKSGENKTNTKKEVCKSFL